MAKPAKKTTATNKPSKSSVVIKLLSRGSGATIAEIVKATGWQEHSSRAFLTGIRKTTKLFKEQRSDGKTAYRIEPEPAATAPAPVPPSTPAVLEPAQ